MQKNELNHSIEHKKMPHDFWNHGFNPITGWRVLPNNYLKGGMQSVKVPKLIKGRVLI